MMNDDIRKNLEEMKRNELIDLIHTIWLKGKDSDIVYRCIKDYLLERQGNDNGAINGLEPMSDGSGSNGIVIEEKLVDNICNEAESLVEKAKKKKIFDMSNYHQRHIALQVQYEGGSYYGFASQKGECDETIEKHLFHALTKLRLITDRKECNFSRCGRTDKGVSALGQVVALRMRSSLPKNNHSTSSTPHHNEMDYCTLLNKSLPDQIRIIGYSEVSNEFSARFSATHRTYRYFFMKQHLNIPAMQEAVSYLIGTHDFRNLCKLDTANVSNFIREIYDAKIVPFYSIPSSSSGSSSCVPITINSMDPDKTEIYMFEIKGIAFLWHMVRCIMSILFLIGEEKEKPSIILELFNCSAKPIYSMAPELPLVLHECGFENLKIQKDVKNLWNLTFHYESQLHQCFITMARLMNALDFIKSYEVSKSETAGLKNDLWIKYHGSPPLLGNEKERKKQKKERDGLMNVDEEEEGKMKIHQKEGEGVEVEVEVKTEREEDKLIRWSEVVDDLRRIQQTGRYNYIPLLQRRREETYEEKKDNLTKGKKERLLRHIELRNKNSIEKGDFFQIKRKQGSVGSS